MSLSLILACFWVLASQALLLFPSRDRYWKAAYALIALGIPLLGYVIYENDLWVGLLVLAGAMSILRWPVIYLTRWIRKR